MSVTNDAAQESIIELLVHTDTVRAWRVGSDYDIECKEGWSDEDFDHVVAELGLEGRTDFDLSYIPETGMEIFRLPVLGPVPRQRGLGWVTPLVSALVLCVVSSGFLSELGIFMVAHGHTS